MSRNLLVVLALSTVLSAQSAFALRNTEPGLAATPFSLPSQSGKTLSLPDMLGRKATLVLFWASWSPRSAAALAHFEKMYRQYGPEDLQVIAINTDSQVSKPDERAPTPSLPLPEGFSLPVAFDRSLRVCRDWGVVAVPSVVLIDGKGHVAGVLDGYPPSVSAKFRARAAELLEGGSEETVALRPDDPWAGREETR